MRWRCRLRALRALRADAAAALQPGLRIERQRDEDEGAGTGEGRTGPVLNERIQPLALVTRPSSKTKVVLNIDEVAASIVFLASSVAQYITGETLRIDGAQSLWGHTWEIP